MSIIQVDETKRKDIHNQKAQANRAAEYKTISDPLFMKWQRNEIDKQEWLDAVEQIREKFPYDNT